MPEKHMKKRHRFFFVFFRPVGWILALIYHCRMKVTKLEKGKPHIILSNHQSAVDPALLAVSFHGPVYFVATDSIFNDKWWSRFLQYCFAPIKKNKGMSDFSCVRQMFHVAKEGGNIAIFPDGNRTWFDAPFQLGDTIGTLVRKLRVNLVLYNFRGGFGVNPRWGKGVRKGRFTGETVRVLTSEEIAAMPPGELNALIMSTLTVSDRESGERYRSRKRAENLEHLLFACPVCGSMGTMESEGNTIRCTHCGAEAEYTENLVLDSKGKEKPFPFTTLLEWYRFQQDYVRKAEVKEGEVIFRDSGVKLYDKTGSKRQILLHEGEIVMDDREIVAGNIRIPLSAVAGASPVGGRKLSISTPDKSYFLVGNDRFNPIKYLLFFNILCPEIRERGGDEYYGLDSSQHSHIQ